MLSVKSVRKYYQSCYCSKEYASSLAARIDGNGTLASSDYFIHSQSAEPLNLDVQRQTGSSHVSVIGSDEDFVTTTVSVAFYSLSSSNSSSSSNK